MKKKQLIILILLLPSICYSQKIYDILQEIKYDYKNKNYYSGLNLCREIIKICNSDKKESECFFTNIMKDVYKYKGLFEYEIYKVELKITRLDNSIKSLKKSYNMFNDEELLFLYGYLSSCKHLLIHENLNLSGLVDAWNGILELYAHDNWTITKELLEKLKDYILISEKYTQPSIKDNYSGKFACYMIISACNLAEKAEFNLDEQKFFNKYRKIYKNN